MPRISEETLESTFFLYPSADDAKAGTNAGGTGFVIAMPSENVPDITYFYGVTNWHVALNSGCSVVRLNTTDGSNDVIEFGPEDWVFDPNGDDIAIVNFNPDFTKHECKPIPTQLIYQKEVLHDPDGFDVGLGDDVFMIGRFVDMDGSGKNSPTARFGSISAVLVPVLGRGPSRGAKDGYCLDMRSRTGYSGSPVFVYRTPGTNLHLTMKRDGIPDLGRSMLCLLGVHRGQFDEELRFSDDPKRTVLGASGMTTVVPAWKILELLQSPELKHERERNDAIWNLRSRTNLVDEVVQTNSTH